MPSSATLAALRDRIEAILVDNSNDIWATGTLDEAIQLALDEYSEVMPLRTVADQALTAVLNTNGRQIDVSGISDLVSVVDLWAPYVAADDLVQVRKFEFWQDQLVVYLPDGDKLETTETARIFFTKFHTLNGLNSAVATTFRIGDDSLLVTGAVGYAAQSRAIDLVEQVKIDDREVKELSDLGVLYLKNFRERLGAILGKQQAVKPRQR